MNPSTRKDKNDLLRQLPSVHEILTSQNLSEEVIEYGRSFVRETIHTCLDNWRNRIQAGQIEYAPNSETLLIEIAKLLQQREQKSIRRVINGTGILLHTGLGRAPLAEDAVHAVLQATAYCNVEFDLSTGERTKRHEIVQEDLCALTGAEAALVVNNNAGATGLVLATFATGRELIVSHGQLIEIGGGYRLPELFRAYGVNLRAVGTTNRTRKDDYEAAINERTGAIMIIHTSNYQVVGFTEQPELSELVDLARDRDFPVIHDLGSGALINIPTDLNNSEPLVNDSVIQGADLVLFSGDKLFGGPQAGIIVGKRHLIEQLAQHPMSRALRTDKLTLAALEATISIYRRGESNSDAYDEIPFLKMIRTSTEQLETRARKLADQISAQSKNWKIEPLASEAYAGGGSLPGNKLSSWAIAMEPTNSQASVDLLSQRLRTTYPAVVGRIQQEKLLVDLRGVLPCDDEFLVTIIAESISDIEKQESDLS